MAHVIQNKKKLLARINRIRGQINAVEKALIEGQHHETGIGEYMRLALMGLLVIASLTGWWRSFMTQRGPPWSTNVC
jgi:hypothetical protein